MSLVKDILQGEVPTVPFSVSIDERSIIKLSVAAIVTAIIIILVAALAKTKK